MDHKQFGETRNWEELIAILNEHQTFIFSTHLEPDADGLGSELGLARYLKSIGKTVHIFNPSPLRVNLGFLPDEGEVKVFNVDQHTAILNAADVFIAFDIGNFNRLNELCPILESSDIIKVSIDHHPGDKFQFQYRYDFPAASSTGVLIFDLIHEMDQQSLADCAIAKPLYAAIMSDTGNFRFNNTDPETFAVAAQLVAAGVKPYELYVQIYEDLNTQGRLIVLQDLLNGIQYECEGRLAWSVIDFEALITKGATPDDLHSLSDFIRSIKGVEIGVSITKMPNQPTDVSFRSKGYIPINGIAKTFDGGGHAFAAGCRIALPLEEAAEAVVAECRKTIHEWDANA